MPALCSSLFGAGAPFETTLLTAQQAGQHLSFYKHHHGHHHHHTTTTPPPHKHTTRAGPTTLTQTDKLPRPENMQQSLREEMLRRDRHATSLHHTPTTTTTLTTALWTTNQPASQPASDNRHGPTD